MRRKGLAFITLLFTFGMMMFFSADAQAALKMNNKKLVLEKGTTAQLDLVDPTYDIEEEADSWTSSDSKVVKVEDGLLTPVSVGSAIVTAKLDGKRYTSRVTVVDYTGMSVEQKQVVSFALKYVGNKYRYGGTSLTKGTDCSGFTLAVYKKFGYSLTHNSYSQIADTKKVKMKNIKPGDLIFYGSSKRACSHVALYIGNGKVVHASTETTGIVISDYKYRKYVAVGRVLESETYPGENTNESVTRYAKSK
ncbi:MAG: C40 family peptidase [Lachnospiraceae bacterium]|nr:C40 family peptidase [Lachnospiraceae bacterium]